MVLLLDFWCDRTDGEIAKEMEVMTRIVYKRDKAVMRELDKLVADFPDIYKLINQTDIDKTYFMPKSYVTYRKLRKLSDGQREQARQKMKKINSDGNYRILKKLNPCIATNKGSGNYFIVIWRQK